MFKNSSLKLEKATFS